MRLHMIRAAVLSATAVLLACHQSAPVPTPGAPGTAVYSSGETVVAAMHDRYAGKWFRTLTFKQTTSRLLRDGRWDVQTWYEALKLPGQLRIDFAPITAGNGVLYARDSQFVIQNGRVSSASGGINDLLLLGFDVYGNAPARTNELLRKQGFDLTIAHVDTFQGRSMIVVGAPRGDVRRKQFWIDTERLVFVRMLERAPRDTTKVQDIRFAKYEPSGDSWIATRVELYTGDVLTFAEDYSDLRADVPLDDALFVPSSWKTARHWLTVAN